MESIQNSCIYNKSFLEPALFLGAALLAGRFVQHFPNTSQSGLLLSTGLASVGTCIYNNTLHDDNHALFTTMLAKAVIIAAANFGTTHLAKALSEKGVAFSLESALKMGGVQFVASSIISAISIESPPAEKTIQEKHYEYRTDIRKWQRLTYEERTEVVMEFIKADLPYFCSVAKFDESILPEPKTLDDWNKLTLGELHWVKGLYADDSKTMEGLDDEERTQVFKLYADKGIFLIHMIESFINKPDQFDFVRPLIGQNPYSLYFLSKNKNGPLYDESATCPTLNVSSKELSEMDLVSKFFYLMILIHEKHWDQVSEEVHNQFIADILRGEPKISEKDTKKAILKQFAKDYPLEKEDLTSKDIQELEPEQACDYLHIMIVQDGAFSRLTIQQQEAFKEKFLELERTHITENLEHALSADTISALDNSLLSILCNMLRSNPNPKGHVVTALVEQFNAKGIKSWDSISKVNDIEIDDLNQESAMPYFKGLLYAGNIFSYDVDNSFELKKELKKELKQKLFDLKVGEENLNKLSLYMFEHLNYDISELFHMTLIRNPDLLTSLPTEKKEALVKHFSNHQNSSLIHKNITVEDIQKLPREMVKPWHDMLSEDLNLERDQLDALNTKFREAGLEEVLGS